MRMVNILIYKQFMYIYIENHSNNTEETMIKAKAEIAQELRARKKQ